MAATTAGGLKAAVEAAGLGLSVYRDGAPSTRDEQGALIVAVALPYVTVTEAIAVVPDLDGTFDAGVAHTVAEQAQVSLWQRWRSDTGQVVEDYLLPGRLARALRGVALPLSPGRVYGVRVVAMVRLLQPDENVVQHALTVAVHREE